MTNLNQIKKYSDRKLHEELKNSVEKEREILAEVISFIQEVDARRLYFHFGYPSLFEYLVSEMKYSNASAQRRISAARLLKDIPELKSDLENGSVNLGQISLITQSFNQKTKETTSLNPSTVENLNFTFTAAEVNPREQAPKKTFAQNKEDIVKQKKEILQKVKNLTLSETQKLVTQDLELDLKPKEKKSIQKDESVYLSITLTKEEAEVLQKAKDLISHINPGAKDSEVIKYALAELVKRKDPALKKGRTITQHAVLKAAPTRNAKTPKPTFIAEVKAVTNAKLTARKPIRAHTKKLLFTKHQSCQWKDHQGHVCGSKFQLQIDHIQPVWAGGTNNDTNLQLLCAAHNRLKYQRETGCR